MIRVCMLYVYTSRRRRHQDLARARTAGSRFARDNKSWDPSWGKQLPGEWSREAAET
jgi:hypothetical protein